MERELVIITVVFVLIAYANVAVDVGINKDSHRSRRI